jgi:hypothetical protein
MGDKNALSALTAKGVALCELGELGWGAVDQHRARTRLD